MRKSKDYAFLMVDYETPSIIKSIQKEIDEDDLYTVGGNGIVRDTHVTIVPCLGNNVNVDDLKEYLYPLKKYVITIGNVSKFDCEEYDVLKCAVDSYFLRRTNEKIKKEFPTYSEYKDYEPHITIAYLKKGRADKYIKDSLSQTPVLKPKCFHFKNTVKGRDKNIKFKTLEK